MFLPENIDNYVVAHSQEEPKILQELTKETWQKVLNPRMISGAYQGRILSMISKLIQPKNVLEIGTFTGYSALSIAEGLPKDGTLFTIDRNEELAELQQKYFNKSRYTNQLKSYVGNAIEIIPTLHQKFDLVFIDADKSNYTNYFHLIIGKMNSGGIILSDNVLWYGKVAEKEDDNVDVDENENTDEKDEDTIALQAYNTLLNTDDRLETVMLPIRDGLTISRVK